MTVEKYREERTKVYSNQEIYRSVYVEYEIKDNRDGIPFLKIIEAVDNLDITRDKIYCDDDCLFWYTPPTKEEVNKLVEQDVQNFIRKRKREKKEYLKIYIELQERFGELSKEEIEAILEG